ncbi:MAG: hypothetical protein IPM82_26180 [Saprospiraceae bacterium]|nr:hypothetical protein [Saprospiraceae bacterium]
MYESYITGAFMATPSRAVGSDDEENYAIPFIAKQGPRLAVHAIAQAAHA